MQPGPVPLWFQIADRLNKAIKRGEFSPGEKLPSESELNRQFGVSRTTARTALDWLKGEGHILRRSGKGSIVLPPVVDQPLKVLSGFAEDMRARGLQPSYRTLAVVEVPASAAVAEALNGTAGMSVIAIDRLLLADGYPIGVSLAILSPTTVPIARAPTIAELDSGSLYEWLERACGTRLVSGEEFIEAAVADPAMSKALQVSVGAPVLVARRTSRTADGVPVEYVVLHYRADRYRFRVELVRP